MRRSTTVAALAATVLLTVTACGSDDTAPSAAGSSSAAATSSAAAPGDCVPASTDGSGPVPALSGTPTDTTVAPEIGVGGANPPTALKTDDVVVGTGAVATPTSTVVVQYSGVYYCDGAPFDSSWSRGQPTTFPLTGVIPGFTQGISGMAVGGRREIVVPPDLGYGAEDYQTIPGGSTLVFVVDLVSLS